MDRPLFRGIRSLELGPRMALISEPGILYAHHTGYHGIRALI